MNTLQIETKNFDLGSRRLADTPTRIVAEVLMGLAGCNRARIYEQRRGVAPKIEPVYIAYHPSSLRQVGIVIGERPDFVLSRTNGEFSVHFNPEKVDLRVVDLVKVECAIRNRRRSFTGRVETFMSEIRAIVPFGG